MFVTSTEFYLEVITWGRCFLLFCLFLLQNATKTPQPVNKYMN